MHILLVADGRSPITRRWVKAVTALGHRITLVSSFPCLPVDGVEADVLMPVAFGAFAGQQGRAAANVSRPPAGSAPGDAGKSPASSTPAGPTPLSAFIRAFRAPFLAGRYLLGPLTLDWYGPRFRRFVQRVQPDLVHALRIPYEGMLAAYTPPGVPMAVSIWGNDLTLHARGSSAMAGRTRRCLARADALLADAARDIRLGRAWGFAQAKPTLVVPGNGGLDLEEIERARRNAASGVYEAALEALPADAPLVLNPRGFRTGSVRNDTFFQAIPLVLERRPGVAFACAAMAGQPEALRWIERLNLQGKVDLLPLMPQAHLWRIFLHAQVSVSISQHDGTPNSLLEAMALGCFPVTGDIESLREWITPGLNGLLVPPDSPPALAEAILLALDNPALRERAAAENACIIRERVEQRVVGEKIEALYQSLVNPGG